MRKVHYTPSLQLSLQCKTSPIWLMNGEDLTNMADDECVLKAMRG